MVTCPYPRPFQVRFVTDRLGHAKVNTYPPSLKCLCSPVTEISNALQNVENGVVRSHPSLPAMSPFDRAHTTSYSSLIDIYVYLVPFMRYSLRWVQNRCILVPLLRLTLPAEGFLWNDLHKILRRGQRMASVHR